MLVGDLAGYTGFAVHRDPAEVAAMLRAYYEVATPLIARRYKGEVEKFTGDGIFATFNRRGDQPDHARRAVGAAAALQAEVARIREPRPDWPGLRVGVNSGAVVVSEMGGSGYVVYAAVGDTMNVAARLQSATPVGGVLVGERTRELLDDATPLVPPPACTSRARPTRSTPACSSSRKGTPCERVHDHHRPADRGHGGAAPGDHGGTQCARRRGGLPHEEVPRQRPRGDHRRRLRLVGLADIAGICRALLVERRSSGPAGVGA